MEFSSYIHHFPYYFKKMDTARVLHGLQNLPNFISPVIVPETFVVSHMSLLLYQKPDNSAKADHGRKDEDLTEQDLERIQNEVDDLQEQFDAAVVDKHSLEVELLSMKERLKAATDMVDR